MSGFEDAGGTPPEIPEKNPVIKPTHSEPPEVAPALPPMVDDFGDASSVTGPEVSDEGHSVLPPLVDDMMSDEAITSESAGEIEDLFRPDEIDQFAPKIEEFVQQDQGAAVVTADAMVIDMARSPMNKSMDLLRENIECLLIAMMMALFIRHYGFEPFQIPTGSMATTLLGKHVMVKCPKCGWEFAYSASDESSATFSNITQCVYCRQEINVDVHSLRKWGGEKILANKFTHNVSNLFGQSRPDRYETIVFRPPGRHQNFIKRMVSAGGETLYVEHGDIFVKKDGDVVKKIAPKPEDIQDAVWIPVYDMMRDISESTYFDFGNDKYDQDWKREQGADKKALYTVAYGGHSVPQKLQWYLGGDVSVTNKLPYNNDGSGDDEQVGDIRLTGAFTVKKVDKYSQFKVVIKDGSYTIILTLRNQGQGSVEIKSDNNTGKKISIKSPALTAGKTYTFELKNWDDQLRVIIDGSQMLPEAEGLMTLAPFRSDENFGAHTEDTFYFEATDITLNLTQLKVWRDIHYMGHDGKTSWHVPENCFFAMGDNVNNSNDSRQEDWGGGGAVPFDRMQGTPWLRLIHLDMDRPFSPYHDWKFGRVR